MIGVGTLMWGTWIGTVVAVGSRICGVDELPVVNEYARWVGSRGYK